MKYGCLFCNMTPAGNAAGLASHLALYLPEYAEVQQEAHPNNPDKYRAKTDDLHHVGLIRSWIGGRQPGAGLEKWRSAKLEHPADPVERAVLWRFARNLEVLLEQNECAEWKRRDVSATGKAWWEQAMNDLMEEKETARSVLDRYRVLSGLPAVGFGLWDGTRQESEVAEGKQAEVAEGSQKGGQQANEGGQRANESRVLATTRNPQRLVSAGSGLENPMHAESAMYGEKLGTIKGSTALSTPHVAHNEPQTKIVVNFNPTTIDLSQAAAGTRLPGGPHRQVAPDPGFPLEQHRGEEAYACYRDPPTQPTGSKELDAATTLQTQLTALLLSSTPHVTKHLTLGIDNFGHRRIVHITPHTQLSDILEAAFHSTPPRVRNLQKSALLRGNGPIHLAKGVRLVIDGWMDHWTESVWERISAVALTIAVPPVWECEVVTGE